MQDTHLDGAHPVQAVPESPLECLDTRVRLGLQYGARGGTAAQQLLTQQGQGKDVVVQNHL